MLTKHVVLLGIFDGDVVADVRARTGRDRPDTPSTGVTLPLSKLGLLPRISLALFAVGFLPLVLVSLQLIGLTTEAQKDAVWGAQLKAASAAASHINEYIYLRGGLAESIADNPVLLKDAKSQDAAVVLQSTLEAFVDLEGLALVNGSRQLVVRAVREGGSEGALQAALEAPASDVEIFEFGGEAVARFEAEVADSGGARAVLLFNTGSISDALRKEELGSTAELALMAPGPRTIAGPVGLAEEFTEDELATAPNTDFSTTAGSDLASSSKLGQFDWFVVARQPRASALQRLGRMRRDAGLAVVLTSLLILALIGSAFRSIVQPIRELTRAQSEVAGIDFGRGGNEIEQLRTAFEVLERRVKEKEKLEETFLGRYQVLDVLGEGAMGMVFRGWDPKLERAVALKTIRLDRELPEAEREKLAERLVQEAKTVARFTDPNIVAVYDVQQAGDLAFIAMELIEGHSLDEYIRMHGARPENECARVGVAVARALASAHRHGVVHQDIKPGNVLLADDGQIKVVDFGVASLVTALIREDDVVFGTPGFMPPEALDGEGFTAAGDLFSLGALLYQMGTGSPAFVGRGLSDTLKRTYAGVAKLEPLSSANPEISGAFEEGVNELLAKQPGDRPADALVVAANFDRFVPREGIVWRPTWRSTGPTAERTHERPKSRLLASSVIDRLADR